MLEINDLNTLFDNVKSSETVSHLCSVEDMIYVQHSTDNGTKNTKS